MRRSLSLWQFAGFVFTGILGVILHFLFDWTNESIFVAPISAVNESIFEHMKILFVPMFLFAVIENKFIGEEYDDFWCVKFFGIVLGIFLITFLYYMLNGIFGKTPDFINIAIFYIATGAAYVAETKMLKNDNINCDSVGTTFFAFALLLLLFVQFTFFTPKIPLFQDPITGTYGYFQTEK